VPWLQAMALNKPRLNDSLQPSAFSGRPVKSCHSGTALKKAVYVLYGLSTLTLHTHAEEKRVRVRQVWARAVWDRMNST
jgi:hypothetical protein